jgi:hypothetical protein
MLWGTTSSISIAMVTESPAKMADVCATCGRRLGLRHFLGATLCSDCAAQERAAREAALKEYKAVSSAVADPRTNPTVVGQNLPAIAERAGLDAKKTRELNWQALLDAFAKALADEIITRAEEERLGQVAAALGFSKSDLEVAIAQHQEQFFIARVNDGRIPVLDSPTILLKRDERAHLQTDAQLLKEVVIREYKGGSQGMSFRIAKGVSYRVGSHRGTLQVVGSRLETADSGILTVTSQRVVFAGARKTVEVRYDKLVSLNIYGDAIQFHVTNRQTASLFKVASGSMIAAAVNAAAQERLTA